MKKTRKDFPFPRRCLRTFVIPSEDRTLVFLQPLPRAEEFHNGKSFALQPWRFMSAVIPALRFDTKKCGSNNCSEVLFWRFFRNGDTLPAIILKPTEKERKMSSYRDLQAQIEQLQKKAEEARKKEIDQVVAEIKSKLDEYGLTIDDLQNTPKKRGARKAGASTVAPKYRNESTGETWSGRGKPPKWIAGKDKSKFLIG